MFEKLGLCALHRIDPERGKHCDKGGFGHLYPGADPVVVLGGHSQSPGELGQHRIQLRHGRYCARPASVPQPSPRVPAGPARLGG